MFSPVVVLLLTVAVGVLVFLNVRQYKRVRELEEAVSSMRGGLLEYIQSEADRVFGQVTEEARIKTGDYDKYVELEIARLKETTGKTFVSLGEEVGKDIEFVSRGWKKALDDTLSDFQVLMKKAYLAEYEKMKRSPPKPSRAPKRKVDAPDKYRSLDDD